MKGKLEFRLPEEQTEFEDAMFGAVWHDKFEQVWARCFRPRHKHLFNDTRLNDLLNGEHGDAIGEYLDLLENIYHEINE